MAKVFVTGLIIIAIAGIVLLFNINTGYGADADEIKTLLDAKSASAKSAKPILLKFFKTDCEYCSQSETDAENNNEIKQALAKVVQLSIDIRSDYGKELSLQYKAGINFPVFFLLNGNGEIIKRWTGYTTAAKFLEAMKAAMSDKTTVEQRIMRFEQSPSYNDAIYLAEYFTDIMDYGPANKYYRQARLLGNKKPSAYTFEIFQNTANASWQDSIGFDEVLPSADTVLMLDSNNPSVLVKTAQIMARLARKSDRSEAIAKYLQAAIAATENPSNPGFKKDNILLKSEYALCIEKDTVEAINLKVSTLSKDWLNKPDDYYGYAKWCLDHKVDLANAEMLAKKAIGMASPGEFRGKVYNTLAMICATRENYTDAVKYMQLAIQDDSKTGFYNDMLDELIKKRDGK